MKRAEFAGRRGSASAGEYSARAIWLWARWSKRASRTQAGASVIASRTCWTTGRMVAARAERRRAEVTTELRARSDGCPRPRPPRWTAQPRQAAGAAVRRQTGLVRGEPCAARGEELTDIALGIHAWRLAPAGGTSQVLAVPGTAGGPAPAAARFIRTGRARLPRHGRRRRSRRRRRRWTDPAATAARCRPSRR